MGQTLTALHRFLRTRPGFEAVLIAPTLSMGRQLLAACAARFGGVLGVRVHTPDTLSLELCGANCPGILSHDAGALLVLSLLRENGASWPFFSALGADRVALPAARALLEDLLLLEREEKDLPAGPMGPVRPFCPRGGPPEGEAADRSRGDLRQRHRGRDRPVLPEGAGRRCDPCPVRLGGAPSPSAVPAPDSECARRPPPLR